MAFTSMQAEAASPQTGESDQSFVERITRHKVVDDGNGHFQIARNSKLLKDTEVLIAFTNNPFDETSTDLFDVHLNIFVKKAKDQYESLDTVIACEVEGGTPTLNSFFYVDLKGESNPAVAVICSWPSHPAAECQLSDEVRFFKVSEKAIEEIPMDKYKTLFYKEKSPDPKSDFTCKYANFKSAKEVKELLKKAK